MTTWERTSVKGLDMLRSMNSRISENVKRASPQNTEAKQTEITFPVNPAITGLAFREAVKGVVRGKAGHDLVKIKRRKTIHSQVDREVNNYIQDLKKSETYSIYGLTTALPENNINSKFVYFYKPYNFNCNTKMFMTYEDGEGREKVRTFDDYVRMKKQRNERLRQQLDKDLKPKNRSLQPSPLDERSKSETSEQQHKDRQALTPERKSGWEGVTTFLLGDPRTRKYIVDQVNIMHGREKNMR